MAKCNESIKITIELTEEQREGYPLSTETLWFDLVGEYYQLKNIPFFIDNLSYDDLVSLSEAKDGEYRIKSIVNESENSTIWVSVSDEKKAKSLLDKITETGCGMETGVLGGYYAINIPQHVDIEKIYSIIDKGEKVNLLIADYPSIRH